MNKYELWYSASDNSYTMFPAGYKGSAILEGDAVLQETFEAPTWEDARRQQHEFLGWEPYVPFDYDKETPS